MLSYRGFSRNPDSSFLPSSGIFSPANGQISSLRGIFSLSFPSGRFLFASFSPANYISPALRGIPSLPSSSFLTSSGFFSTANCIFPALRGISSFLKISVNQGAQNRDTTTAHQKLTAYNLTQISSTKKRLTAMVRRLSYFTALPFT